MHLTDGAAEGANPRTAVVRIIVPARNESERIEATVRKFCEYFGPSAIVLVVVNGCTDDTAQIIKRLSLEIANLELLEIEQAVGKGGAVRAGLTLGSEPFVAFVDADGSATADQLDVLLERCRDDGVCGVLGSRWLPESRIARKQPFRRRLASRVFNTITRIIFGLRFTDTQCGAKIFRRDAIDSVIDTLEISNFAFDVDLLLAMKRLHLPVVEVPISWDDVAEYSKVTLVRSGSSMLWALARLWLRESVFRTLPFVDALGRSETIPVRKGLSVLVLLRRRHTTSEMLATLLSALRQYGHEAYIVTLDDAGSRLRFAQWYARRGHLQIDAIVHAFGKTGSRILRFSAKPKFSLDEFERDAHDVDVFVRRMVAATKCPIYFHRSDLGWHLSSNLIETTLPERKPHLTSAQLGDSP